MGKTEDGENKKSRTELRRTQKAKEINENPEAYNVTYISPQLIQCTLPHRDPGKILPFWRRTDGLQTLTIRPSFNEKGEPLYPWGSYPRLLLFWMTEEAITTGNRVLNLGRSMSQFTAKVGIDITGGKDARNFKNHMARLFDAVISFEYKGEKYINRKNMVIADDITMWWDAKRSEEENIFASSVELSEKIFNLITDPERRPVPLDYRVIDGIKQSPLAIDLYTTMTYAAYETQRKGKKELISWTDLHQKLGADYKDLKKFRQNARRALEDIHGFYPALRVDATRSDMLILHPSPPSISKSKAYTSNSYIIDSREIDGKPR